MSIQSFGLTHCDRRYVDELSDHACTACVRKRFWEDNLRLWGTTCVLWVVTVLTTWFIISWGSQPGSSDARGYTVVALPSGSPVSEKKAFDPDDDTAVFLGLGAILLCVILVVASLLVAFQSLLALLNAGGKVAYTHGDGWRKEVQFEGRAVPVYKAVSRVRLLGFYSWTSCEALKRG